MLKIKKLFYLIPFLLVIVFTTACSKKYKVVNTIWGTHIPIPEIKDTLPKVLFCNTKLIRTDLPKDIIQPGIESPEEYMPLLSGKKIAVVTNQTGIIDHQHIVDYFLENNVDVVKVFSPEHGFRGNIERGKEFADSVDAKTGLPMIALYGKNKKPNKDQLRDVDVVVFDIQDVGVRFFTYISTMHYLMEACAENNKHLIILDRPNPLGDYVDGPVLKPEFKSFVGMHPIPIVHGLTVGELAMMINGEKWLQGGIKCKLTVIRAKNYTHSSRWPLVVKPSPNLPDDLAVRLYPSLCFFEATEVSIGRGTHMPFKVIGYPDKKFGKYTFVPHDIIGMQTDPLHEGSVCFGINLQNEVPDQRFTLKYLLEFADKFDKRADMITRVNWFNLLAGNSDLYQDIINGLDESAIKEKWKKELDAYKLLRKKYLLYPDFE